MNWSLFIAGVLISWILIGFATALYVSRHYRFVPPADDPTYLENEANTAIVEALCASLTERSHEWITTPDGLKHANGTQICATGREIWIRHEGLCSVLPERLAAKITRAAQVRNAKVMLADLAPANTH